MLKLSSSLFSLKYLMFFVKILCVVHNWVFIKILNNMTKENVENYYKNKKFVSVLSQLNKFFLVYKRLR